MKAILYKVKENKINRESKLFLIGLFTISTISIGLLYL